MAELWTYSLEDVLLFRPRVYWRLFELHNEAVWPLQIAALLAGAAIVAGLVRPRPWTVRAAAAGLAVAWAWVAWSFLWQRYATINWAMEYVAPVFALQGLVLAVAALRGKLQLAAIGSVAGTIGIGLLAYALVVHPLLPLLAGRPIQAAEVFAIAPDPTAIATLGFAAILRSSAGWLMMIIPLAWCAVSWATLYAMGSPQAWIVLAVAVLAVAARTATARAA